MAWRIAKSLDKLRSQVNAAFPGRNKSSDGTIGDEAHASRNSDHNPWVKDGATGVVTGMDITNDPKSGLVARELAEALIASRDPRIKYIISNAQICAGTAGPSPWKWRPYNGANAHRHHVHISVKAAKASYDSVKAWKLDAVAEPVATIEFEQSARISTPVAAQQPAAPLNIQPPTAVYRAQIETMQRCLDKLGYHEVGEIDGLMGGKTKGAIAAFLTDRGLKDVVTNGGMEGVQDALSDAMTEGWSRPIAPARANATAKDIAPKVASVAPTQSAGRFSRALAWVTGFFTIGGGVVKSTVAALPDANEQASPVVAVVQQYAPSLPSLLIFAVVLVLAVYIARKTGEATQATVTDYNTGKIN